MRRIWLIPALLVGFLMVAWVGLTASDTFYLETSEDILKGSDPACSLPSDFPSSILRWCPLIESAADETGLPAGLIAAVILQESSGDPLAYSSSGAVGLMQVMPRDGLASAFMCINGPCFATRPTINDLQDPLFNISYGSQMLAALYARHGSYRDALFHYGPMDRGYGYADRVLSLWEIHQ